MILTHCQTDIFRHSTLRNIREWFIRTPTFDVFGHFAGRSVSIDAFFLQVKCTVLGLFISLDLQNVFPNFLSLQSLHTIQYI